MLHLRHLPRLVEITGFVEAEAMFRRQPEGDPQDPNLAAMLGRPLSAGR